MKYFNYIILALLVLSAQTIQAQAPQELKSYLPEVSGWKIAAETEVFNPSNLFERINGAAPLFLENNFREMTSMEYKKGEDYITIQVYRHASSEDAFGMYASERSSELTFIPIGGEAQGDDAGLYFFAGCIYVKMQNNNASEETGKVMQTIAQALAKKIAPDASYPLVIRAFPAEGRVPHTEAYITSNFIGHEFLKSAYTVNYEKSGNKFQLFVIDAKETDKAKGVLSSYFTFTKQPLDFKEGSLLIKDKYNGDIPCIWEGRYIIGIISDSGKAPGEAGTLLNQVADKLKIQ